MTVIVAMARRSNGENYYILFCLEINDRHNTGRRRNKGLKRMESRKGTEHVLDNFTPKTAGAGASRTKFIRSISVTRAVAGYTSTASLRTLFGGICASFPHW